MPKKHRRTFQYNGTRIEKSFDKKADADEWVSSMKRNAQRARAGLPMLTEDRTLLAFCAEWVMNLQKKKDSWRLDESSLRRYILPRLGDKSLRYLSTHEIETELLNIRDENGLSDTTFNRHRSLMHKVFRDAIRAGFRDDNPVTRVVRFEEAFSPDVATDAEIEKFLEHAAHSPVPGFFVFMFTGMNCGTRPSETITIKAPDLLFDIGLIHINKRHIRATGEVKAGTKGKKRAQTRHVPMNETLAQVLRWQINFNADVSREAYVFQRSNGSLASINTYNSEFARIRKLSGIRESVRLYDLTRHAFGTRLSQKGNMRLVQLVLGHSTSAVTEKYAHARPDFLRDAGELVIGGEVVKLN